MKTGIIVGRFQVPTLTNGHKHLIKNAALEVDQLIIFIGDTKDGKLTPHDPLPFEARVKSINQFISQVIDDPLDFYERKLLSLSKDENIKIFRIVDVGNYPKWVENLDSKIEALRLLEIIPEDNEIFIIGSRDSVAQKYKDNGGKFDTIEINELKDSNNISISGTEYRKNLIERFSPSWDMGERKFAIWLVSKISE